MEKKKRNGIPELTIGHLVSRLPIIQGGMGVGISMSGLASAVASEGGIGVISAVMPGIHELDMLRYWLGQEPDRVYAEMSYKGSEHPIERLACVMVGFFVLTYFATVHRGPNWDFYWWPSQWPGH